MAKENDPKEQKKEIALQEIEAEHSVVITVSKGLDTLEFETKTVQALGGALLLQPITYNDKMVNFNFAGLVITMTVEYEPLPFRFIDVKLDAVIHKNEKYHRIRTEKLGKPVNRRGAFRVFVGETGQGQIDDNHKARELIVRDVSANGFSVVVRPNAGAAAKDLAMLGGRDSLFDINLEYTNVRVQYQDLNRTLIFRGKAVRRVELEDGRILFGCTFYHTPAGLEKYIHDKQMQMLKRMRGDN